MKIIYIILCIFILNSCTNPKNDTLIITDYIPSKQITINNFDELQKSANTGNAVAQYEMGKLYAAGLGVTKSHRNAIVYWKKSAMQGYAPAQYSLGWMYFNGNGVVNDFKEGCKWMRSAGEQGIQEAINYYNNYCIN